MINPLINRWTLSMWIAIFFYFILTLSVSLSYYWGGMTSMIDIGTFDQSVWGTLHGYPFLNTIAFNKAINYLGLHFRPILLIFLPFYVLLPKVEWMILAQSFALSLTAWPIYLVAKQVTRSESSALFWALVYMVNPFVMGVSPWVFRPESLAVPFVALALLSIEKSNFRLLLLSCLFIVLCKEHFGVMVIGFGFLWGLRNRSWKKSILLISLGAIYSILVLGVVMPSLSPIGKHVMFGKGLGQLSRYSWIGNSLKEVFLALLFHPVHIASKVFKEMGGATYLVFIFLPFLGLPLLAPEFLLPGLADFLANILSAVPMPRSLYAYHSITLIPVLTVAAVYGSVRISCWIKRFSVKELAGFVVITSFIFGYYFSPLPLPGAYNLWAPTHFLNQPDPNLPAIRSAVGEHSSVSAQSGIGAYFSQRLKIYQFPNKVGDVDIIVLSLEIPTTGDETFLHLLGMQPSDYLSTIENLLMGTEYRILLWKDPWLVMGKGQIDHQSQQVIEVKDKLTQLKKSWQAQFKLQL